MKVLKRETYRRVPWRNGLGETEEIAVQTSAVPGCAFDWRISMAPVVAPGAFSVFPDIDRILTVIEGAGLRLTWPEDDGEALHCLPGQPAAFAGDRACQAELLSGPIVDLNVMTRREGWLAEVVARDRVVPRPGTVHHLIFAMDGPVEGAVDGVPVQLESRDTLWLTGSEADAAEITGRWLDIQLRPAELPGI